jgi:DNA-binding IclR family transcriptional regulator
MTTRLQAAGPSGTVPRSTATAAGAGPAASDGDAGERYVIWAADRALAVVAGSPAGLDVPTIVRRVNLPGSTVFRILQTLRLRGLAVETRNGGDGVGPRAFEVGSLFLQGSSLRTQGEALVERIVAETGETARLGIRGSDEVLYIAVARGQREPGIQSVIGTRHPVYCTVLGKVLLADLSCAAASALLSRVDRKALTGNTIIELDSWRAELVRVAEQGYAPDLEERTLGVRCAAAPVRDHSGRVVAAVSAARPAFRIAGDNLERIVGIAKEHAASFSWVLGYVAP